MRKCLALFAAVLVCGAAKAGEFTYAEFSYDRDAEVTVIAEPPAGMVLKEVGPNLSASLGASKRSVVWATKDQAVQATVPARLIAETVVDEADGIWHNRGEGRQMGSYGASSGRHRLFGGLFRGRGGRAGGG